ncbi:MAG TPA: CBS and ACT domain-containing protein [Candidatus Limnocylindrales bacterium]|nr:CBS and ACT domain-containing protein [Candidatus Limnocylindrales bacterium]
MFVQDIMQPHVTVVDPGTPLSAVMRLLQRSGVRHLPVVESGAVVGIVSDRDVKGVLLSAATAFEGRELAGRVEELRAGQIMTQPVTSIGPMFPVEAAAQLMLTKRISALPVVEQGHLVGIITETDILRLLVKAMGASEPSSRLDVVIPHEPSALAALVAIVVDAGMTVSSIVTLAGPGEAKQATIRVTSIDPRPAVLALEAKGYKVRGSWRG